MAEVVVPLTIRDLTESDLPACGWYGTATDLAYVAEAIQRAQRGEVDYLAVCGIGTILIGALEQRARDRGLRSVELGVDDNNSRPRTLYERLGYSATGNEPASWNRQAPGGFTTRYETRITLMRKQLS